MRTRLLSFPILLIAGAMLTAVFYPLIPVSPVGADYGALEETIRRYDEIENQANCTLDDSRLAEVLINDWRGGDVNQPDLMLVQNFAPSTATGQTGILAVKQALYLYLRTVKEQHNQAIADGQYPPTIQPEQIPEIKTLMQAAGGRGMPMLDEATCLANITPHPFTIQSVRTTLFGDVAFALVEFQHFTSELVFIKANGQWYLAGGRAIQIHAG